MTGLSTTWRQSLPLSMAESSLAAASYGTARTSWTTATTPSSSTTSLKPRTSQKPSPDGFWTKVITGLVTSGAFEAF